MCAGANSHLKSAYQLLPVEQLYIRSPIKTTTAHMNHMSITQNYLHVLEMVEYATSIKPSYTYIYT